jgi:hypothetical protein
MLDFFVDRAELFDFFFFFFFEFFDRRVDKINAFGDIVFDSSHDERTNKNKSNLYLRRWMRGNMTFTNKERPILTKRL